MLYWINMKKSIDRKIFMENQLTKYNIPNIRIEACSPITNIQTNGKKLSKSEYGCLISHMKALKYASNGSLYSIIMEDDTVMPYNINFQQLIDTAPSDWEILQLYCSYDRNLVKLYNKYKQGILWDKWHFCNFSTGIYIIKHNVAKKIIDLLEFNGTFVNLQPFNYKAYADAVLYRNSITYTCTYPLYYTNITKSSTIHPSHDKKHLVGVQYIQKIHINDKPPDKFIK